MNRYTPEQYNALITEFKELKKIAFVAGQRAREQMAKGTNSYARGKKEAYDSFYELISDRLNLFRTLNNGLLSELLEDKDND